MTPPTDASSKPTPSKAAQPTPTTTPPSPTNQYDLDGLCAWIIKSPHTARCWDTFQLPTELHIRIETSLRTTRGTRYRARVAYLAEDVEFDLEGDVFTGRFSGYAEAGGRLAERVVASVEEMNMEAALFWANSLAPAVVVRIGEGATYDAGMEPSRVDGVLPWPEDLTILGRRCEVFWHSDLGAPSWLVRASVTGSAGDPRLLARACAAMSTDPAARDVRSVGAPITGGTGYGPVSRVEFVVFALTHRCALIQGRAVASRAATLLRESAGHAIEIDVFDLVPHLDR